MSDPAPFLTAEWRSLLMLNYVVDPSVIQCYVPRGTFLDTHEGNAYVSVVGFMFTQTRLKGIPIPLHQNFEEVNLRFYVRREIDGEVRRGVVFIKELVPKWAIAAVARYVYNENYIALPMDHAVPDPVTDGSAIAYKWRVVGRWYGLSARVVSEPRPLAEGSHAQFIAEHYWGYAAQKDGGTVEYRVAHPPWRVWDVRDPLLDADIATLYGPTFMSTLSRPPDSAFLAEGSAVTVYDGVRLP